MLILFAYFIDAKRYFVQNFQYKVPLTQLIRHVIFSYSNYIYSSVTWL